MAKVRVKPKPGPPVPAPAPPPKVAAKPNCLRCARWGSKYFAGKPLDWVHTNLCLVANERAEESKATYFSLNIGEVREREAERLLMDLIDGVVTAPAPAKVKPEVVQEKSKPPKQAHPGPKSPEPAKVTPKPVQNPPAQRQSGLTGKDAFGFRLGSGAALINEALTSEPLTMTEIAARSKATRAPNGQIIKMTELGFLEQLPGKKYRLTPKALESLKKHSG